jgi:uncharacterized protein
VTPTVELLFFRLPEMPPLRILILSDGRPGHYNLSEGIAGAIARLGATTVERLDVQRGNWPGALLATLTTGHLPAEIMLQKIYGIAPHSLPAAGLVVSAGAETLAASIWVSRAQNIPNIHYGSIRLFDPQDFALVLTSYRRNTARPRHALALKPSRLDPDTLSRPHVDANLTVAWPPRTAALLIGGDTRGITYAEADWNRIVGFMATLHRSHGTIWRVANSRRTPDAVSDRIASAIGRADCGIDRFLDVRNEGPGTLTALLAPCDAVLCTADSSSMISECIWMQLPTIAIEPDVFHLPADEAGYRAWLQGEGWCSRLAVRALGEEALKSALAQIRPGRINQQEALARLIDQSVPGLFKNQQGPLRPTKTPLP